MIKRIIFLKRHACLGSFLLFNSNFSLRNKQRIIEPQGSFFFFFKKNSHKVLNNKYYIVLKLENTKKNIYLKQIFLVTQKKIIENIFGICSKYIKDLVGLNFLSGLNHYKND